jgi:hypothetical protein
MKTDANSYWSYLIEVAMGLRTGKLGKIAAAEQIEALAARMNADRSGGPNCAGFTPEQAKAIIACRDAMIEERDWSEAYHQLYTLQTQQWNYDPFNPWIALEKLASRDATSVTSEEKA